MEIAPDPDELITTIEQTLSATTLSELEAAKNLLAGIIIDFVDQEGYADAMANAKRNLEIIKPRLEAARNDEGR